MVTAILPIVLLRVLELPEFLYGVVFVAARLAVIAGAWIAPVLESRTSIRSTCSVGLAGIAASAILIATGAAVGSVAGTVFVVSGLAVQGIAGTVWNIGLTTLFTRDTDSAVLGRASVNVHTLTTLAAMAGAMLGGWVASSFSVRTELWISVGVALAGTSLMAFAVTRRSARTASF